MQGFELGAIAIKKYNQDRTWQDNKQELSGRKQIARQLCTQYVEGIYKPN